MSFRPWGRRRIVPVPAQVDGNYRVTLANHFDSATAALFTADNYSIFIEGAGYVDMTTGHKTATFFDVLPMFTNHVEWFTPCRIHIIPDFEW